LAIATVSQTHNRLEINLKFFCKSGCWFSFDLYMPLADLTLLFVLQERTHSRVLRRLVKAKVRGKAAKQVMSLKRRAKMLTPR